MTIGAYVLIEPNTGYYYFGSSEDVEMRIERHYRDLSSGQHHCQPLQELWNKHHQLEQEVFPTDTRDEAYQLEQAFITSNSFNQTAMLNIGLGVRGGDNLSRNPNRTEIVKKITGSLNERIGDMSPEERREKWSRPGETNPMFGRAHTDEVRQRLSQLSKGNQHARGAVRSVECRQRLSESASSRTGERNAFYGKRHSDETKDRIRQASIGKGSPTNALKVSCNGVVYDSVKKACEAVGISYPTMVKRLASTDPKYSNYHYVS